MTDLLNTAHTFTARYKGLQASLELRTLWEHQLRRDKAAVERELATIRMELEDLKVWFARARAQGVDVPVALTIRQLDNWRKLR